MAIPVGLNLLTNAANDSPDILLLKDIQKHADMHHTNERNACTRIQTHTDFETKQASFIRNRVEWCANSCSVLWPCSET